MDKVSATTKGVRVSPRKVRLVADSVRNMTAKDAIEALTLIHKRGASVLLKTIQSAVANAVNNSKLNADSLIIDVLEINEGPFLKRFHASTRGRVHPFKKRSSHITVILKAKEEKAVAVKSSDEPKEEKAEKTEKEKTKK